MTGTSWVEICVSNFEQSITWFENVLGFRVIRREGNEFAELSRDETSILVAADDAPYWEAERSRLLPSGQRGSGVEIVLLVENVDAVYSQAQQARADIVRELADYPWHMRQFSVRHPDGYLIRPAQKILSVDRSGYYQQIAAAFRPTVSRIVDALTEVKQTADRLALQQDYFGAVMIYEALVKEIFEESHLYYNEEEEERDYDDYYDEEEPDYPAEEGLKDFVEECITALGSYLADERVGEDTREQCIDVLFDIYQQDVFPGESHGFSASVAVQLVKYATPAERGTLAEQVRTRLAKAGGSTRPVYAEFLLDLQKDVMEDEAYLQICRENGLTSYLVDRLLTRDRVDEAVTETQAADDINFLALADLFVRHEQDAVVENLVKARIKERPGVPVLEWLRQYYQSKGNQTAALDVTETLLRTQHRLKYYQELRDLAKQLDRWPDLRPKVIAFLEESKRTKLLVEVALDEGDIDTALQVLKGMAYKNSYGTFYDADYGRYSYGIDLDVARAAEETHPREAIELYRQRAERLIAHKGREYYQAACTELAKMRSLYEKLGELGTWASYIAALREQNRKLPALKDELARAKL